MEVLENIVSTINTWLSNYILLILLVGVGLYYTIRTKFVQVRCFGEGMRSVFGGFKFNGEKHGKSGMSSFQALATAISAQVGTGNIVGACAALLVGGPGAIFWMWVIAFFGMATIYGEAVLAQKTKTATADGETIGGPVYYIRTAFKGKFGKALAIFFAIACILALGFMGNMVQSNSIAGAAVNAVDTVAGIDADDTILGIDTNLFIRGAIGIAVAIIAGFIFLGGVQRIASVSEKIVPIMACLYIVGSLIIIFANIAKIPEAFGMIFRYAFDAKSIVGGSFGAAIYMALTQGAKRGLFSNEAGMGSTPHAHAVAKVKNPHDQGVVAMIGVFIDTFIVLTMTALVVIVTLYTSGGPLHKAVTEEYVVEEAKYNNTLVVDRTEELVEQGYTIEDASAKAMAEASEKMDGMSKLEIVAANEELNNTNLAQRAFSTLFGNAFGNVFVAVCLLFFAFSTIIGWYFFGKQNMIYLFGKKSVVPYSILCMGFVVIGSILEPNFVWDVTDMFNNLMVIPNAIALLALGGIVAFAAKSAKRKKKNAAEQQEESGDAE